MTLHAKVHRDHIPPDLIVLGEIYPHQRKINKITLTLSEESIEQFKTILSRALNTFPEAHPDWKELWDMMEHGYVLQDYRPSPKSKDTGLSEPREPG